MSVPGKFFTFSGAIFTCFAMFTAPGIAQSMPDPDVAQMPPPASRSSDPVRKLSPAQIVAELKRGGYVVYFRHTSTDFSQNDLPSKSFEDCAHQRNLTDAGRAQAREIGAAIRHLSLKAKPRWCADSATMTLKSSREFASATGRRSPACDDNQGCAEMPI